MREALDESNLEQINIDNLQQGKDNEGNNMPRYRNPEYANFKTSINPKNRGYWDLRLHGEYYRGIEARINPTIVFFRQKANNNKIKWLHDRLTWGGSNHALGITKKQMFDVQLKNKPKIRKKIEKIISNV